MIEWVDWRHIAEIRHLIFILLINSETVNEIVLRPPPRASNQRESRHISLRYASRKGDRAAFHL
jgi:hypothetical protein